MVPDRLRRALSSPVTDVIVRVSVVVSVVVSGFLWAELEDLTHCVADYNNANNARSVVLTAATEEERRAERKADDAQAALFLNPNLTKRPRSRTEYAEILRLFRAYQTALTEQREERAAADAARRVNPVPDPPSEVCG